MISASASSSKTQSYQTHDSQGPKKPLGESAFQASDSVWASGSASLKEHHDAEVKCNGLEMIEAAPFRDIEIDLPIMLEMAKEVAKIHDQSKVHGDLKLEAFVVHHRNDDDYSVELMLPENQGDLSDVQGSKYIPIDLALRMNTTEMPQLSLEKNKKSEIFLLGLCLYRVLKKFKHPFQMELDYVWTRKQALPQRKQLLANYRETQTGLAEHVRFGTCRKSASALSLILEMTDINPSRRPEIGQVIKRLENLKMREKSPDIVRTKACGIFC